MKTMKQAEFHGGADGWDGLYVDVQASFEHKLREMGDRVRGISWFSSRAAEYRENLGCELMLTWAKKKRKIKP